MDTITAAADFATLVVPEAFASDDTFAAEEWTEAFLLACGR